MNADSDRPIDAATIVSVRLKGDPAIAVTPESLELDLSKFHSGRWAAQLDSAIVRRREPVVLMAQGVACLAVAWWAKLSPASYLANVRGAIFLSPLTVGFGQASIAAAASVSPAIKLPFASIVTAHPSPVMEQVLALADSWGGRFVEASFGLNRRLSNLRGPASAIEEKLLGLLDLLGGGAAPDPHPVEAAPLELVR